MNIFSVDEAAHYCNSFKKSAGSSRASLKTFLAKYAHPSTNLKEGTADFDELRDCLLREVDRLLYLAAVHFKKSHDLLSDSSCSWAHVTMYYGTYYSAQALLAMFGAWVDFGYPERVVIYVDNGLLTQQELIIKKKIRNI